MSRYRFSVVRVGKKIGEVENLIQFDRPICRLTRALLTYIEDQFSEFLIVFRESSHRVDSDGALKTIPKLCVDSANSGPRMSERNNLDTISSKSGRSGHSGRFPHLYILLVIR